jgi:hypothetical protein
MNINEVKLIGGPANGKIYAFRGDQLFMGVEELIEWNIIRRGWYERQPGGVVAYYAYSETETLEW